MLLFGPHQDAIFFFFMCTKDADITSSLLNLPKELSLTRPVGLPPSDLVNTCHDLLQQPIRSLGPNFETGHQVRNKVLW